MAGFPDSTPAPRGRPDAEQLRRLLADAIEAATAAFDRIDGDPDLEPAGDEELALQPIALRGGSHVAA